MVFIHGSGLVQIIGGGGVRNFEPMEWLSYSYVDRIIQKLRWIYQEKPESVEMSTFAQKQY